MKLNASPRRQRASACSRLAIGSSEPGRSMNRGAPAAAVGRGQQEHGGHRPIVPQVVHRPTSGRAQAGADSAFRMNTQGILPPDDSVTSLRPISSNPFAA